MGILTRRTGKTTVTESESTEGGKMRGYVGKKRPKQKSLQV